MVKMPLMTNISMNIFSLKIATQQGQGLVTAVNHSITLGKSNKLFIIIIIKKLINKPQKKKTNKKTTTIYSNKIILNLAHQFF